MCELSCSTSAESSLLRVEISSDCGGMLTVSDCGRVSDRYDRSTGCGPSSTCAGEPSEEVISSWIWFLTALRVPNYFAGQRIAQEFAVDLCVCLSLLHRAGYSAVGKWRIVDAISL